MRLKYIDGLRAFAVLPVVLAHHSIYLVPTAFGVTLFFVISGFVITKLLLSEFAVTGGFRVKAFFARRALKILPPFLVAISLPTFLLWRIEKFDIAAVFSQHFFFYNWFQIFNLDIAAPKPTGNAVLRGSQVVWSLAVEEQFYILLAILWFVLSRRISAVRSLRITFLTAFFGSIFIRAWIVNFGDYERSGAEIIARVIWGTDCRLSGIALGGLLAISVAKEPPLISKSNWLVETIQKYSRFFFIFGLSLIPATAVTHRLLSQNFNDIFDLTFQELAAYLLIATGLTQTGWPKIIRSVVESRPIQKIGLASYSIYLIHFPFKCYITNGLLNLDSGDLLRLGGAINFPFFSIFPGLLLAAAVSIIPGLIIHQVADAPLEKYRKRWRVQKNPLGPDSSTVK